MELKTKQEIERCLEFLANKPSANDKEMAERGMLDWFLQSLVEDGLWNDQT